jgi:hypothetical protein
MVAAERPDTLDLLRRNADILTAEAARGGFTDLDFSFSEQRHRSQGDDLPQPPPDRTATDAPGAAWPSASSRASVAAGGLDLRL